MTVPNSEGTVVQPDPAARIRAEAAASAFEEVYKQYRVRMIGVSNREALRAALEQLNPRCQETLCFVYLNGGTIKSLADALDISPKSAKTALHRCRERARKLWKAKVEGVPR